MHGRGELDHAMEGALKLRKDTKKCLMIPPPTI